MGPASTKLQELRAEKAPFGVVLWTIASEETVEMKAKYMRLTAESKEHLMSLLGGEDPFDVLESEEAAKNYIAHLSEGQKEELVDNLNDFMERYNIDLTEPPTPALKHMDGEGNRKRPNPTSLPVVAEAFEYQPVV